MRKIGFMPYKDSVKEVLPSSFKINMQAQKRRMFICMLNEVLPAEVRIYNNDCKKNLKQIFMQKIFSFFQVHNLTPHHPSKVVRFYLKDSALFQQFFKHNANALGQYLAKDWEFDQSFQMQKDYEHPVSSLIELIFNGKETQMMLDLNALFTKTVYKRIKPSNDIKVSLDMPYIHISEKGRRTRLIPTWKKLNPSKLSLHHKQIKKGFEQLNQEKLDSCYLIYPKTDSFRKHITLQGKDQTYLKLVPYSFTFTNKKNKKASMAS